MNRLLARLSAFIVVTTPSIALAQNAVPEHAEESLGRAVAASTDIPADSTVQAVPAAAHEGGLPQFNTETWPSQIFWLVISFSVLYFFFSKFILPRMTANLENRADKIRDDIQTAEALSAKAEGIRSSYEADLKRAASQASSDMKVIDEEAKAKLANSLAEFKSRYDAEIEKIETRLEQVKDTARGDMQKIAAEIASQAAEKIAGIPADQSQADTIIQSLKNKAA